MAQLNNGLFTCQCDFELLRAHSMNKKCLVKVQSKVGDFWLNLNGTLDNKTRVEAFSYGRNLKAMSVMARPTGPFTTSARERMIESITSKLGRLRIVPIAEDQAMVVYIDTPTLANLIEAAQQCNFHEQRCGPECDI